jgi:hypothetical protein
MADDPPTDDARRVGPYMAIGYLLLADCKDRAAFSRHIAEAWGTIARLEKHEADKARLDWRRNERRTPSGMLKTVDPRDLTEKHDMRKLIESTTELLKEEP